MQILNRTQLKQQVYKDLIHDANILSQIPEHTLQESSQKTAVLDDVNQLKALLHNTDREWVLTSKPPFRYYLPLEKYKTCRRLERKASKASDTLKVDNIIDEDCVVLSRSKSRQSIED